MQWKNTSNVIEWFESIKEKKSCRFVQLDIKEFDPSITEQTLDKAVSFTSEHVNIPEDRIRTIKHCKESLLYHANEPLKKKCSGSCFDVTMGSYNGVSLYIMSLLEKNIDSNNVGLYRDDSLILLKNPTEQQTDRIRKKMIKIFKEIGFKIEITTNLNEVDFLDVTFNLENNTYCTANTKSITIN